MCGIIGYIGDKEAVDVLLNGLFRLEYRGYDSAGIAVISPENKFSLCKKQGKIKNLETTIKERKKTINGTVGIGHTRWATHGVPSDDNAHPHSNSAGNIVVVHNGIIENYKQLRDELIKEGHTFLSDTDTEVIPHLIEKAMRDGKTPLEDAVRSSLKKIRGTYALGVLCENNPEKIVAARMGSPLILGVGKNEHFIASDIPAILDRTNKVVYLEDGQIAVITTDSYQVYDLEGNPLSIPVDTIEWKMEEAEKGGFEKFMLKEIHEQPMVVKKVSFKTVEELIISMKSNKLNLEPNEVVKIRRIYIVSCGTAFFAGFTGKYILEHYTSIPVEIDLASEFRYRDIQLEQNSVVIAVSQSGETADTLASIRKAKELGCKVISIVNVVGSTLDRESDGVLYTHAGPEIGVASTKAYMSQLAAFYLLAVYCGRIRYEMSFEDALKMLKELGNMSDHIQEVLDNQEAIKKYAKKYHRFSSAFYLGRGFNYPVALEGALKNKEISYMHAEGYAAGEMKHGPIALIDEKFLVIAICTEGKVYEKVISNLKEVQARSGKIVIIANKGDKHVREITDDIIEVPHVDEELSPMINVVPLQLFAYYLAKNRGCDIDKPRNLAKSVTVE